MLNQYSTCARIQPADAKPDLFDALHLLAVVQSSLGKKDTALASYDRALTVRSDYAEALSNRGNTLHELKRFEEALASYDRALTVRPDFAEAHWNEALLRLLTGDFNRGWVKYAWRWKNESRALTKRNFSQPLWLGADAFDGKTICFIASRDLEMRSNSAAMCHSLPHAVHV